MVYLVVQQQFEVETMYSSGIITTSKIYLSSIKLHDNLPRYLLYIASY